MTAPRPKLPAPLTPPDIDCRKLAGFMLNTERLLASELWALSTGEEFKAALALWCRAWKQSPAGSLPNDQRVLASFAGATQERWGAIREVALRGWVLCSDGRLYHPVLCEDALRAHGKRVAYQNELALTRERMRRMRERQREARAAAKEKRDAERDANGDSERNVTRNVPVMFAARDGTVVPSLRDEAAAAGASRPEGGDAKPTDSGAPGSGPAPRTAAAATSRVNPDANARLRALLGKNGLAAAPQAALEWEGMLTRKGLTKTTAVASFLRFCGKRGDVQFARQAEPLVVEWMAGAT